MAVVKILVFAECRCAETASDDFDISIGSLLQVE